MLTRCVHDGKACPHGGCASTLCARHEFVPATPNRLNTWPCGLTVVTRPQKGMDNGALSSGAAQNRTPGRNVQAGQSFRGGR